MPKQSTCLLPDRRLIVPVSGQGHIYSVNGRPLVAVTTVIHEVLRAPALENWYKRMTVAEADAIRDEAAAFSKTVHAALTAHASQTKLIPMDLPENWELTVEAGRQWIDANLEEVYAVEQPIVSLKYGYAGQPDIYGRRIGHKEPCIIDAKVTGGVYWSHLFQTAAYRRAAVETYGDRGAERIVLWFDKEQPGRFKPYSLKHHDRDFSGFGYCLGLYNILKEGVES